MKMNNTIASIGSACTGCSICRLVCSKNAITLKENREGFTYPVIDMRMCELWIMFG